MKANFLIFGGTSIAKKLAREICLQKNCNKIYYSLVGMIDQKETLVGYKNNIITVYSKFSNYELFNQFIKSKEILAVIDALHPFAERMREKVYLYSARQKIPFFSLNYPIYQPKNGESWISLDTKKDLVDLTLYLQSKRPFFAIGYKQLTKILEKFCQIDTKITLIFRSITKIEPAVYNNNSRNIDFIPIIAKPSHDLTDEIKLFSKYKPDLIVAKNSGLDVFVQKVKIAHQLGIPLVAIESNKNIVSYSQTEIINLLLKNNLL